ncbi:MAG: hypothetical protein J6X18_04190 [Bacteroidales bacterium]|nr:hypothetical protein [Bacteroidales bacterium]
MKLKESRIQSAIDEAIRRFVNEEIVLNESFKSQKLKDFARAHGGLKQGKWSADFKNDLYNMSDEDFETYKIVSPDEHYARYGLNGWDLSEYSNNNFQPLVFGDGTFMVKKSPEYGWDDRAKGMMDKQIARRNSRRNDGKNEYQFENPYLNDRFNQDYHISKPRGSWGYGTDWKLEPNNINMTALRSMEGYDKYPGDVKPGDVAAKAKAASNRQHISKDELREMVKSKIRKMLKEGAYGYPDTVDGIILCSENDRELYDEYVQIAKAVAKVYKRDAEITFERLVDSSILKKYQQHCFGKYGKENPDKDRVKSPRIFREYVAQKIIDEVLNGQWDERHQVNEKYTDDPNDGYDYQTGEPYYPGVSGYYSIKPEGVPDEVEVAQNTRNRETGWTKRELDNRNKMMDKYVKGERSEDDIDDAWYGIHMNESHQFDGSYGYQNVPDEFVEKLGENGYEVIVPDYCLPYLVNGDLEGYTDEEIQDMQNFEKRFQGKLAYGLNVGDCCVPRDGEEPTLYGREDVFKGKDMGAECYRFFLPAKEAEKDY